MSCPDLPADQQDVQLLDLWWWAHWQLPWVLCGLWWVFKDWEAVEVKVQHPSEHATFVHLQRACTEGLGIESDLLCTCTLYIYICIGIFNSTCIYHAPLSQRFAFAQCNKHRMWAMYTYMYTSVCLSKLDQDSSMTSVSPQWLKHTCKTFLWALCVAV